MPHDRDFLNHAGGEGWHLDRALFDAELLKLAQAAGAEFRTGTTVTRAARDAGGVWTTLVCNGERIAVERTEYLVDATGRAARLARMLGATIQRHEQFIALHALLAPAEGAECDDRLWLEAARDGWAYSAPLPEGKLSVGFVTTTTHRAGPQTLRAAALFSQTTETLSRLAPDWTKVSWRARLAGNTQLSLACDEGWFAVGDAVAAFDPLTSYGLTFALGSAILAGEAIVECVQGRTDVALIGYRSAIQHTSELTRVGLSQLYATETRWREAPFWRAARARSYDKCAKEVAVIHQLN